MPPSLFPIALFSSGVILGGAAAYAVSTSSLSSKGALPSSSVPVPVPAHGSTSGPILQPGVGGVGGFRAPNVAAGEVWKYGIPCASPPFPPVLSASSLAVERASWSWVTSVSRAERRSRKLTASRLTPSPWTYPSGQKRPPVPQGVRLDRPPLPQPSSELTRSSCLSDRARPDHSYITQYDRQKQHRPSLALVCPPALHVALLTLGPPSFAIASRLGLSSWVVLRPPPQLRADSSPLYPLSARRRPPST